MDTGNLRHSVWSRRGNVLANFVTSTLTTNEDGEVAYIEQSEDSNQSDYVHYIDREGKHKPAVAVQSDKHMRLWILKHFIVVLQVNEKVYYIYYFYNYR